MHTKLEHHPAFSIAAVTGRYFDETQELQQWTSEAHLMKYRYVIMCAALGQICNKLNIAEFNDACKKYLFGKLNSFKRLEDLFAMYNSVKVYEKETNHDVKAIEKYIAALLRSKGASDVVISHVHFGATSRDVNSLAQAVMFAGSVKTILDYSKKLLGKIEALAKGYSNVVMVARTHGQPAVPTTFGKEMRVLHNGLFAAFNDVAQMVIPVKYSGAAGTFGEFYAAHPDIDWVGFETQLTNHIQKFLDYKEYDIKLVATTAATQTENFIEMSSCYDALRRLSKAVEKIDQDMWWYISSGLVKQKQIGKEAGSSVMPQKTNPIRFENSEANSWLAQGFLFSFSDRLPVDRLQGDLRRSALQRAHGEMFGHLLLSLKNAIKGFDRIDPDVQAMFDELYKYPEVITAAMQTVLRGKDPEAYSKLKEFTKGKQVTIEMLQDFAKQHDLEDIFGKIDLEDFIGLSPKIAQS